MNINGEEIEAPSIRRTQDGATGNSDNQDGIGGIASFGSNAQYDSPGFSGKTGEVVTNGRNRRTIAGGMLKQLIEETVDQLQQTKKQQKKLESRLEQLTLLSQELCEKTGETINLDVNEEE